MNRKVIYVLIGIAFVFFVTSLIIFLQSKRDIRGREVELAEKQSQTGMEEPQLLKIRIFFYTENSSFMRPVQYEIENLEIKKELYEKFINLLITGRESYISPTPEGLELRSLFFIEDKKMLVLDFNENLIRAFPSGSSAELEFIYFIVDNICFNFEEIEMVKFLVGGNEYKTISGHIDIENPFYPDYRYLKIE